jgi:hypothetical protein
MKSIVLAFVSFVAALLEPLHRAIQSYMSSTGMLLTAVQLPNGSIIEIAASYGDVTDIDALSNAAEAVATISSSHGIILNDIVEITSGWSRLTGKIARVGLVATNDITLEDINTLSTQRYPAGQGVGTLREILTWTQLQQILTSSSEGGDQQYTEYQFLEADAQKRLPTVKSASGIEFSIADDPALAGYLLCDEANEDRLPRAVRVTLPSGALIFYNARITLNKIPTLTVNEIMAVTVTLSLEADPVRYTS